MSCLVKLCLALLCVLASIQLVNKDSLVEKAATVVESRAMDFLLHKFHTMRGIWNKLAQICLRLEAKYCYPSAVCRRKSKPEKSGHSFVKTVVGQDEYLEHVDNFVHSTCSVYTTNSSSKDIVADVFRCTLELINWGRDVRSKVTTTLDELKDTSNVVRSRASVFYQRWLGDLASITRAVDYVKRIASDIQEFNAAVRNTKAQGAKKSAVRSRCDRGSCPQRRFFGKYASSVFNWWLRRLVEVSKDISTRVVGLSYKERKGSKNRQRN